MGCHSAHVLHQLFELVFGTVGGKVGDLGLEAVDQIMGGIDDGCTEVVDLGRIALHGTGKAAGFGVQTHAQHGVIARGRVAQHVDESHKA